MATDERDRLSAFALRVWGYKQGEVVSLMIHLGDRLGLYRAMAGRGPMTAARLAAATGLQERWLLEWLRGQAAAGLIGTEDGEAFEISAEAVAVLADNPGKPVVHGGRIRRRCRTAGGGRAAGRRLPVRDRADVRRSRPGRRPGDRAHDRTVDQARPGAADPARPGRRGRRLQAGASWQTSGTVPVWPRARWRPLSPAPDSKGWTRRSTRSAGPAAGRRNGLENVEFRTAGAEDLPGDNRYDLVLTLDCLHDMPRPAEAAAAIRRAVRAGRHVAIKDIRSGPAWQDNLRNPVLALMHGLSVTGCLSSGCRAGRSRLGSLGLHPGLAERTCRETGFSRFTRHDFDDPVNLYYEVRP